MSDHVYEIAGIGLSRSEIVALHNTFRSDGYAILMRIIERVRAEEVEGVLGDTKMVDTVKFHQAQGVFWLARQLESLPQSASDVMAEILASESRS